MGICLVFPWPMTSLPCLDGYFPCPALSRLQALDPGQGRGPVLGPV